jgi:hypothetical protein
MAGKFYRAEGLPETRKIKKGGQKTKEFPCQEGSSVGLLAVKIKKKRV